MAIHKTLAAALIGMAAVSKVVKADTAADEGEGAVASQEGEGEGEGDAVEAMVPEDEGEAAAPVDEGDDGEVEGGEEGDAMGCTSVLELATAQGNDAFTGAATSLLEDPAAADLVAIVTATEPLEDMVTIFLPNNEVLGAAAEGLDSMTLINVLLTHVVPEVIMSDVILDGSMTMATAVNGESLLLTDETEGAATVSVLGSDVFAVLQTVDLETCAGTVHVVSQVLIPMGPPMAAAPGMGPAMGPAMGLAMGPAMGPALAPGALEECDDVATALSLNPATAALAEAAIALLPAEVLAVLADPATNLTVLSPPNDLVSRLVGGIESNMLSQEEAIAILSLHVIPDFLPAEDLLEMDGVSVLTASPLGDELMVMTEDGMVMFMSGNTTATVIMADVDGCGAAQIIHQIDNVLLPEGSDVDVANLPPAMPDAGTRALPPGAAAAPEAADSGAAGLVSAFAVTATAAFAALVL